MEHSIMVEKRKMNMRNFNHKHPYLTIVITLIVASAIGITIQYLMNGTFVESGFYTAIIIAFVSLLSTWFKRQKN